MNSELRVAFGPRALTDEGRKVLDREISPIYFVTKQLPPTLIIHGDADKAVPLQQSESFVQRARSAGVANVDLIVRPGKGHGWGDFWKSAEDITAFADWFDHSPDSLTAVETVLHLRSDDRTRSGLADEAASFLSECDADRFGAAKSGASPSERARSARALCTRLDRALRAEVEQFRTVSPALKPYYKQLVEEYLKGQ